MLNPADSAGSLTKLYIFYGVFGGGGVGIGYNAVISTITKWFPDKVGLASGIMLMGFGLGSLLLGSVVTGMVAAQGLFPTFKILAIAITVVMVVGAIIIKAPEAPAAPAEAKAEEKEEKSTAVSFSAGEMLKTSRFWIFFLWAIALNSAGLMVINSAANISLAFGGSAILGMVVSLFNGAGRIIAGNNFDRFGRKKSTLINVSFMMIAGILLVLAGKTNSLLLITVGLVFVGMAYGGTPTITFRIHQPVLRTEELHGKLQYRQLLPAPGSDCGTDDLRKLLEAAGGKYDTCFIAIIAFTLISLVLWVLLNGASKKSVNEDYK